MNWLNKLPNARREPPGLEWAVLRKLPLVLLGGTLVAVFFAAASHLLPPEGSATEVASYLKWVNFAAIASVVTLWIMVFTVAIGCCVVVIMKGPAYVADAYDLSDSDSPRND